MNLSGILLLILLFYNLQALSQVAINTDGSGPHNSAMMDMRTTGRGLLIPRLSAASRDQVPSPAAGLLIFNTTSDAIGFFNGTSWHQVGSIQASTVVGTRRPGGGVIISAGDGLIPDSSAILDIVDSTRGLLIPRTTTNLIVSPVAGLLIFNTQSQQLSYFDGTQWRAICSASTGVPGAPGSQVPAGVAVNFLGSDPHHSAILDVSAEDRGFLLPGMTTDQRDSVLPATGLMLYNTSTSTIDFFNGSSWHQMMTSSVPAPVSGVHTAGTNDITWNWNAVPGASGYKFNTLDDYASALNMGSATTKSETGLSCDSTYTRYIWAYDECGHSASAILTQTTLACQFFTCGQPVTITHVAGTVAPVPKTVTYGTITNIPGEPAKCWISQNLGAGQQASSVSDPSEEAAGWYWQFSLSQGYKHDGTSRTPASAWLVSINTQGNNWLPGNDPCALELGSGWRLPTRTEWTNVDLLGSWTNWNGPWNSGLKLHAAGYLEYFSGVLLLRGTAGYSWSSTRMDNLNGYALYFVSSASRVLSADNRYGYTVRCLME